MNQASMHYVTPVIPPFPHNPNLAVPQYHNPNLVVSQFQNPNLVVPRFQKPNIGVPRLINNRYNPYSLPVNRSHKPMERGNSFPTSSFMTNEPIPQPRMLIKTIPNNSFILKNGVLPLQAPNLPSSSSQETVNMVNSFLEQLISVSNNQPSQTIAKTLPEPEVGLIASSKQQTMPTNEDDSIGLEFDPAKLKVRHESVLRSLYVDLPRQCATCGMRFKTQEKHSHHMDWHLRKNRVSKKSNKQMLSGKYFPSSRMLVKPAEANGTSNASPIFFPTKILEEEKNFEELLAVFANEDQKECSLCMEAFDEYFSDERNDWMFRGTVYMNETKASTRRLYKSLKGRIVHANCLYTKEELQSLFSVSS